MSQRNLLKNNYEVLEEIGHGGFGVVYKARCLSTGKEVAIKKIDTSKVPHYRVQHELEALCKLQSHSNIVQFYDQFKEKNAQYIVMEYCKHKSLRDHVKRNGRLADHSAAYILRQLVKAVKHIHERNLMHRDLSSGNVLITDIRNDKLFIKLADFGLATDIKDGGIARTMLGTPGYIAPQVYGRHYNQEADVFSLGGILYLMLVGKDPPRDRYSSLELEEVSDEGAKLIKQMMEPDERFRIRLDAIRMSDFARKADDFELQENSFRDASRERIRTLSFERIHDQGTNKIRTLSAQPRINSYGRTTKDSAFESGDVEDRKRPSCEPTAYRDQELFECRHSNLYGNNICRCCGYQRSTEQRSERQSRSHLRKGSLFGGPPIIEGASRNEIHPTTSNAGTVASLKFFSATSSNKNLDRQLFWPLQTSRLGPLKLMRSVGRFIIHEDGSVILEVVGRDNPTKEPIVTYVVIVDFSYNSEQMLSLFRPLENVKLLDKDAPPVRVDHSTRRTYRSIEDFQNSTTVDDRAAFSAYRFIADMVKAAGGRVEKIVFKPSNDTTARLMENGDFRLKFSDGRLAVQKCDGDSIIVTNENKMPDVLSDEESKMFDCSRADALQLESMLQKCTLKRVKCFPMYLSNSSLFVTGIPNFQKISSGKEEKLRVFHNTSKENIVTEDNRMSIYADYTVDTGRRPFSDITHKVGKARSLSRSNSSNLLKPLIGNQISPRLLDDSEYELRGQKDRSGRTLITRIVFNGDVEPRSLRISTIKPGVYIYKDTEVERRFQFDGEDYSKVPLAARDMLYTLNHKRRHA